jgi:hypothetical protein
MAQLDPQTGRFDAFTETVVATPGDPHALYAILLPDSSARVADMTLDFEGLSGQADSAAIEAYAQRIAGERGTVSVSGAVASTGNAGDDRVVGRVTQRENGTGTTQAMAMVSPMTLGTTERGAYQGNSDTYLRTGPSGQITFQFSVPIFSIAFDYEIFPDATCSRDGEPCSASSMPELSLVADGVTVFQALGVLPGTSGTPSQSPASGPDGTESASQLLAESHTWSFPGGVKQLDFVAWPVSVGIDNVQLGLNRTTAEASQSSSAVPEPRTLALVAIGIVAMLCVVSRRRIGDGLASALGMSSHRSRSRSRRRHEPRSMSLTEALADVMRPGASQDCLEPSAA